MRVAIHHCAPWLHLHQISLFSFVCCNFALFPFSLCSPSHARRPHLFRAVCPFAAVRPPFFFFPLSLSPFALLPPLSPSPFTVVLSHITPSEVVSLGVLFSKQTQLSAHPSSPLAQHVDARRRLRCARRRCRQQAAAVHRGPARQGGTRRCLARGHQRGHRRWYAHRVKLVRQQQTTAMDEDECGSGAATRPARRCVLSDQPASCCSAPIRLAQRPCHPLSEHTADWSLLSRVRARVLCVRAAASASDCATAGLRSSRRSTT